MLETHHARLALLVLLVVAMTGAPHEALAQSNPTAWSWAPVVIEADSFFTGEPIEDLVGFRYEGGAWVQIPLQVDERDDLNPGTAYDGDKGVNAIADPIGTPTDCGSTFFCQYLLQDSLDTVYYLDDSTHTTQTLNSPPTVLGTITARDEVVFMVRDAGTSAAPDTAGLPAKTRGASGFEFIVAHPSFTDSAFVYVFLRDANATSPLQQDADTSYVAYDFGLCTIDTSDLANPDCTSPSSDYLNDYNLFGLDQTDSTFSGLAGLTNLGYRLGANPEDTDVVGETYRVHFGDRWIMDELQLRTSPSASYGSDLLDRRKMQFAPNDCNRSEFSASFQEGAFVTNKVGPLRVIRTAMGFNSGPLSMREDIFYARYSRTRSNLHVHPITGIMDIFDYSSAASGALTYYDNILGTSGEPINGNGTLYDTGSLVWNAVRGTQSSGQTLVHVFDMVENLDGATGETGGTYSVSLDRYYEDDTTPQTLQCTGDTLAYGFSGARVSSTYTPIGGPSYQEIGNTDPRQVDSLVSNYTKLFDLELTRHTLYDGAFLTNPEVNEFVTGAGETFTISASTFPETMQRLEQQGAHASVMKPGAAGKNEQAPVAFGLEPPAPNPVTGAATLRYGLPEAASVRLVVYDVLGREVAVLVEAPQAAGEHAVRLEANHLPAGVYFARLQDGRRTVTRTFVKR